MAVSKISLADQEVTIEQPGHTNGNANNSADSVNIWGFAWVQVLPAVPDYVDLEV